MAIRVLIVDAHAVVRQGLRYMLEQREDLDVVGECADGEAAAQMVADLLPDVVLLDLLMPRRDGIATIRDLKQTTPSAAIIVLSSYHEDEQIVAAIKAGARSYLLKDAGAEEIVAAVRAAARGESTLHPLVATRVLQELRQRQVSSPLSQLTAREREILEMIARGHTNAEIAGILVIDEPTVRTHVANILTKLHLADRTQAAIFALRQRLVPLDDPAPGDTTNHVE
jgi:two-component system, NarL family, response regulator LiaR